MGRFHNAMSPLTTTLLLLATATVVIVLVGALGAALHRLNGEEQHALGARLAGTLARVTTTIPESGVGAVSFVRDGRRVSRAAKSLCRVALAEGTPVLVVSTERGALVVDGFTPEMKEMFR